MKVTISSFINSSSPRETAAKIQSNQIKRKTKRIIPQSHEHQQLKDKEKEKKQKLNWMLQIFNFPRQVECHPEVVASIARQLFAEVVLSVQIYFHNSSSSSLSLR